MGKNITDHATALVDIINRLPIKELIKATSEAGYNIGDILNILDEHTTEEE